MNLKQAVGLMALIIGSLKVSAQGVPENAMSGDQKMQSGSPVGSSLSDIYTPDLFDGSVNLGIPIYNFQNGLGSYGIGFSYNTKGVKVDEYRSLIGTHWVLNAGGFITRNVKDLPDEMNIETVAGWEVNDDLEDYWYDNHQRYLRGKMVTYTETLAQQAQADVLRDTECDDFTVSVPGMSFTFNFGTGEYIFTHPKRRVKVQVFLDGTELTLVPGTVFPEFSSSVLPNLEFRITDEQGIQYYFSKELVRYTPFYLNEYVDDWKSFSIHVPTRWALKNITFPDGSVITYSYGAYAFTPFAYGKVRRDFAKEKYNTSPSGARYLGRTEEGGLAIVPDSLLTSIDYPNGVKAEFIYNNTDAILNEIKLSNGGNCTRYALKMSQPVAQRWFLDSIQTISCDGTMTEPYYYFTYYNDTLLPPVSNAAQDFYGYYNGDSTATVIGGSIPGQNRMLIPFHATSGTTYYGNNRWYNFKFAKSGTLKSVRNAMGGTVSFRYKAHSSLTMPYTIPTEYNSRIWGRNTPDGICIDSIIEQDRFKPANSRVTKYFFSGGQTFLDGGLFYYPSYVDSATGAYDSIIVQSDFLSAHHLVNGSNHGYSTVEAYTYSDGALSGRTVSTFTNMSDATSGSVARLRVSSGGKQYYEFPYADKQYLRDWELGLPLENTSYDKNGNITSRVTNSYNFSIDSSASAYIANVKTQKVNSGTRFVELYFGAFWPNKKAFTDPYTPYTGTAQLTRTVKLDYVANDRYVADTAWFTYDYYNNLSATTTKNAKKERIRIDNIYNYSVPATPGSTLATMNAKKLEYQLGTQAWKDPVSSSEPDSLLTGSISTFTYNGDRLHAKALYELRIGSPMNDITYLGYSGTHMYSNFNTAFSGSAVSQYIKSAEATVLDNRGNALESRIKDQDFYKVTFWDSISGNKIAEAANCRLSEAAYTSFENNETGPGGNASVQRGNVSYNTLQAFSNTSVGAASGRMYYRLATSDLSKFLMGTQDLSTGKTYVLTFWTKNATPRLFLYTGSTDVAVTLPSVEYTIDGWSFYRVAITPSVSGKFKIMGPSSGTTMYLDEVRLVPSGAAMTSSTYEPLFGKSSETDANGRITYYEYDKLGRLTVVRDQEKNVLSKTEYKINAAY